jgi:hypothetical protein
VRKIVAIAGFITAALENGVEEVEVGAFELDKVG